MWFDGLGGTDKFGWDMEVHGRETTNQNLTNYAKSKGIRLYTISFAGTLDPIAVAAMTTMADSTGGFYQNAPDAVRYWYRFTRGLPDSEKKMRVLTQMLRLTLIMLLLTAPLSAVVSVFQYQKFSYETKKWLKNGSIISGYPKLTDNTNDSALCKRLYP